MNDIRIRQYVEDIFKDVIMSERVREQKEELTVNLTERVKDYMADGLSFDTAFETAKNILGDTDELTASFDKNTTAQNAPPEFGTAPERAEKIPLKKHIPLESWKLAALSPFIYIILGAAFGWWAWGWLVIPVSGILSAPMPAGAKFAALSPFIYVWCGFMFGWWAWGWLVIPIAAILTQHSAFQTPKK